MNICSEFCEMVGELIEELEEVFEGSCLGSRRDDDDAVQTPAPAPGDIIGVDRGLYRHYGVYAGDNKIIHYTAEHADIDPENAEIQETSLERFLRDDTEYFILDGPPTPADADPDQADGDSEARFTGFDADETVARARSRLGERDYNLLTNNCEHFVVWCKTGISDSRQVRNWVALCRRILMGE